MAQWLKNETILNMLHAEYVEDDSEGGHTGEKVTKGPIQQECIELAAHSTVGDGPASSTIAS